MSGRERERREGGNRGRGERMERMGERGWERERGRVGMESGRESEWERESGRGWVERMGERGRGEWVGEIVTGSGESKWGTEG